ncbi:amidohydrolase family protein [Streptomyces sp. A7024]|uniref:Amidohydrolase family protein n=1 Tax=Streptomyces coryli TaxID=1128680 RepID=A0A6G4U1E1_9ACTN|nr:amidohydrolase [Streptomyces coryli]NGN65198.1 amidohydrolase family protein [Streptomyces coryli]
MTPPPLSRRGMLAGAAAASLGAASFAPGAAQAAAKDSGKPQTKSGEGKTVVFRNVRPFGQQEAVDLTVIDGRITDQEAPKGAKIVDGGGRIALPSLVDAHIHPDKTTWGGDWLTRKPANGIADYCAQDVEVFKNEPRPVGERAYGLMAHAVTRGTRAMRAHADVAPAYGLAGVEGVAEAGERLSDALDLEIVAFPQHGVIRTPGTDKLLEEAAKSGIVDFIGGIDPISFDNAMDEQLDLIFNLADKYGIGVDIHLHDRDDKGTKVMDGIIKRTRALSLRGKVNVSHAFCVPKLPAGELDKMAATLADLDISLTTVSPSAELVLPIATLKKAGVRVGLGSDGVRDSWSPFGNADMFHRTHIYGWVTDVRMDDELAACYDAGAHGGSDVLGLDRADLKPGAPADFVLLRGQNVQQVVIDMPQRDMVVHGGQVVARNGELV